MLTIMVLTICGVVVTGRSARAVLPELAAFRAVDLTQQIMKGGNEVVSNFAPYRRAGLG